MKDQLFKALIGVALLALGIGAYRPAGQETPVNNNLKAIQVVSLLENDREFELLLKNVSNKGINGYSISFNNNASRTVDLTVGEKTINPGEQFKVALPHRREIWPATVRYVIFEDGTGEGDSVGIVELQDRRTGRAEQLTRILPLLDRASSTGDVETLRTELQNLPEEHIGARSVYFRQGQLNAREDAMLALKKLDQTNVRAALNTLREQTAKTLERLTRKK
jgi:hypothetical protein